MGESKRIIDVAGVRDADGGWVQAPRPLDEALDTVAKAMDNEGRKVIPFPIKKERSLEELFRLVFQKRH